MLAKIDADASSIANGEIVFQLMRIKNVLFEMIEISLHLFYAVVE
jgi:hypothetical protein